eukprot:1807122-Rhodomonas_salina.2
MRFLAFDFAVQKSSIAETRRIGVVFPETRDDLHPILAGLAEKRARISAPEITEHLSIYLAICLGISKLSAAHLVPQYRASPTLARSSVVDIT